MNLLGSNAKYGTSRVELSPARFVLPIDRESPTFPRGVGGLLPVGTVRMDDAVRMTYAFWSTGSALPEPTIVEPEPEPEPEVADEQPADELASAEEPVEDERTADEPETEGAGSDAIADAANGDAAVADDIIDDAFSDDANDGDALYLDDDDDAIIAGDDVLGDDEIDGGDAETPKAPERLAPTAVEFAVLPEPVPGAEEAAALDALARAAILVNRLLEQAESLSHHGFARLETVKVDFAADGWAFTHVEYNELDAHGEPARTPTHLFIETTRNLDAFPYLQCRIDFDRQGNPRHLMVSEYDAENYSRRMDANVNADGELAVFKVEEYMGVGRKQDNDGHLLYKRGKQNNVVRRWPEGVISPKMLKRMREEEEAARLAAERAANGEDVDQEPEAPAEDGDRRAAEPYDERDGADAYARDDDWGYRRRREVPEHTEARYDDDDRDLRPGRIHDMSGYRFGSRRGSDSKSRMRSGGYNGERGYRTQDGRSRDDRAPRDRDDRRGYGDRDDRRDDGRGYRDDRRDDRRGYGDRDDRRGYGDREDRRDGRRGYGDREDRRDDRRGYGDREDRRDDRRSYGDRDDRRGYGDRDDRRGYRDDHRGYGDRDDRRGDRGYRDNRRSYGDREDRRDDRRGYGDREDRRDDRRGYGDREDRGGRGYRSDRRDYGDRGDYRGSRDRDDRGYRSDRGDDRRSYGDRDDRRGYDRRDDRGGDRRGYGDRGSERRGYGDRDSRDDRGGERRSYGDRDRDRGERRSYGDRGTRDDRRGYGDRADRGSRDDRRGYGRGDANRGERRTYGDAQE